MDSDTESSVSDILDQRNEEGWEDVEDDTEAITVVSQIEHQNFSYAKEMLQHCKARHNFDIWKVKTELGLEFLELIQLVNYVRSEVKAGRPQPDTSSKSLFEDDKYLQPVLEDDAVLFSLDDVFDESPLDNATNEVDQLRDQLAQLTNQFQAYREEVQRSLMQDLDAPNAKPTSTKPETDNAATSSAAKSGLSSVDASYFDSYSYNSIHELMLKDTIRTDTYRDFIYDNKHLFADKVVLDVGCGTGILSMFCAKAGAKRVIAVDNSDIIHKARENVFRNGLDSVITCVRGKIEEVVLPVSQVDIIVSEWMGYCLLYESMLDSVLYARDKYLKPDTGLMVPSHAVIKVAPLGDSDLRESHIDFWHDVYGFDMTAMLEKAHEEALIRVMQPKELAGPAATIVELDLHTATVADLSFTKSFRLTWDASAASNDPKLTTSRPSHDSSSANGNGINNDSNPPIDNSTTVPYQEDIPQHINLEGFVLWFDTPFSTSRTTAPTATTLNLSTSPYTPPTHWQQGVLLIEQTSKSEPLALKQGDVVSGTISYRKKQEEGSRGLDIEVAWEQMGEEGKGKGKQVWSLE